MNKRNSDIVFLVIIIIAIVAVSLISYAKFYRIDFTEDKKYSITPTTIDFLSNDSIIKDPILFEIYLSGNISHELKSLQTAIIDKLDEFRAYVGDKIQYEIKSIPDLRTQLGEDRKKYLVEEGIIPLVYKVFENDKESEQTVFPAILVKYGNKQKPIQLIPGSRNKYDVRQATELKPYIDKAINQLEYKFIKTISRLTQYKKGTVAFLTGHGELDKNQRWDAMGLLSDMYSVAEVEIDGKIKALDKLDALIIAKPTKPFNLKDKFIIDQFIMKGGKVVWMIDPFNIELDSLYKTGQTYAIYEDLGIKNELFTYGVRINPHLILDENCAPYRNLLEGKTTPWYYFPVMIPKNSPHIINEKIDPIKLQYSGSIDTLSRDGIKFTTLIKSSEQSTFYPSPARISYGITRQAPNFSYERAFKIAGVLLEGKFKSAFTNYPEIQNLKNNSDLDIINKNQRDNKMIVIADGDIVNGEVDFFKEGQIVKNYINIEFEPYDRRITYGNAEFLQNSVDYLMGNEDIIHLRSRTITQRLLNSSLVERNKAFWTRVNIVFPLLMLFIAFIIRWFIRKRKYALRHHS